jgi:ATP-dependent DNA helicase RecG
MLSARSKYHAARGLAPESDLELCRRLGVVVVPGAGPVAGDPAADPADPELNNAGALLLCPFEPAVEQLVVLMAAVEGLPSIESVRGPAPLLPLFDQSWTMLTTSAFPGSPSVVSANRRLVRALPDVAIREALVNAMMHRDYRQQQRSIQAYALGGTTFKVRSPGGFVLGVSADRLITTPSVARNPRLADALRVLGLAEREGIGVDTMYAEMLRSGFAAPVIAEDGGDVLVTLRGGRPDITLVSYFEELRTLDPALDGVRVAMAITLLLERTPLRSEELAGAAQCGVEEAQDTLVRLEKVNAVERLANRSKAFRLSVSARNRFGGRVKYPTRRRLEEHMDMVRAFLDTTAEISRDDAAVLLDVAPGSATRLLSELVREGSLETVANTRGPRVRYRLPSSS